MESILWSPCITGTCHRACRTSGAGPTPSLLTTSWTTLGYVHNKFTQFTVSTTIPFPSKHHVFAANYNPITMIFFFPRNEIYGWKIDYLRQLLRRRAFVAVRRRCSRSSLLLNLGWSRIPVPKMTTNCDLKYLLSGSIFTS